VQAIAFLYQSASANCGASKNFRRNPSSHLYWRALISMLSVSGDVVVEHEMNLIIKKIVLAAAALALFAGSPAFAGRQHLNRARSDAARSLSQSVPYSPFQFPRYPRI
jgi:hypothetical protein